MKWLTLIISAGLIVVSLSALQADTIHVPSQQPTIQAGIDAAVDGDTVLVADGTYTGDGNRDIDFLGKAIIVMSENGPFFTIINCEGQMYIPRRGFIFHSGEDSTSILNGFTIRNGYRTYGGAIRCSYASSPQIVNNWIEGNEAADWTGYGAGGGIHCGDSSPIISDNIIIGNSTINEGGGIYFWSTTPKIRGNIISNNHSGGGGGGIWGFASTDSGEIIIEYNIIMGNEARYGSGAGMNLDGWDFFEHNTTFIIRNNVMSGNVAEFLGGGIYGSGMYNAFLTNNTITENTAANGGGGVCFGFDSRPILTNTIIHNNHALEGSEIMIRGDEIEPCTLTINYSNVKGGEMAVEVDSVAILNWGEGMIDEDPIFVLPDKRDYRLLWESPCINVGHPDSLDSDGTRNDMGAYFYNQDDSLTLYITPDTTQVTRGEQLGVTYTVINRWSQPERFWALTQVLPFFGDTINVIGPKRYTIQRGSPWEDICYQCHRREAYTAQLRVVHDIPEYTPIGEYEYLSRIGIPPGTLYDQDSFKFKVIE